MIDNFELIKPLLKFDNEEEFYFLQVIQRKKDHKDSNFPLASNNNNRLIKAYYVYSIEQLDKYKLEIVELCKLFNARAGISLNRKNSKTSALEMLSLLALNIKNGYYNQLGGIYNSVCGQYQPIKDKCWILDVDNKDEEYDKVLQEFINTIQPEGNKIIANIPTKNGHHLIIKPFNCSEFSKVYNDIEIHKNNPTVLYIP